MPLRPAVIDEGLPTHRDINSKTHSALPLSRPIGLWQPEGSPPTNSCRCWLLGMKAPQENIKRMWRDKSGALTSSPTQNMSLHLRIETVSSVAMRMKRVTCAQHWARTLTHSDTQLMMAPVCGTLLLWGWKVTLWRTNSAQHVESETPHHQVFLPIAVTSAAAGITPILAELHTTAVCNSKAYTALGFLAPFVEVRGAIPGSEHHRRSNIITNFTATSVGQESQKAKTKGSTH